MSSSPSPSLETVVESDTEDFETEHDSSFTQEFIKNEITALREEISRQLLLHKEEIIKLLKEENTTLKDEILSLKKELSEKDKLIYEVEKDVVDLQQYIRRNNVEICGIPNNKAQEKTNPMCEVVSSDKSQQSSALKKIGFVRCFYREQVTSLGGGSLSGYDFLFFCFRNYIDNYFSKFLCHTYIRLLITVG